MIGTSSILYPEFTIFILISVSNSNPLEFNGPIFFITSDLKAFDPEIKSRAFCFINFAIKKLIKAPPR